jgi:glucose dehydrogenase
MRRTFVIGISIAAMLALLWTIYAQSPPQRASQQQQLRATAPGGGVAKDTVLPPWPAARNPLDTISPVTDTMLASPAPGEWLTWRRTYDDLGFSPLKQITKSNVKNLRVAWSLTLPAGATKRHRSFTMV